MDCKFINENDMHERYLLDRLIESEKAEYLLHLKSCDACKNKMDSEKELLSSVRHYGKSEMKSEIAKQVAAIKSKPKDVSWDMILKVAAIFFLLVITPGLVYYYQSVEPPKLDELYDFNEVAKQQKETEKVEADEVIETRSEEVKKRTREANETPSDLLKSVSGAGGAPSIKSIRKVKPSKKSNPRVEDTIDLLGEEDSDIEREQSIPSAPVSKNLRIAEFSKPEMVSNDRKELNKANVVSSEKLSSASRSLKFDDKDEQISAESQPSISIGKTGRVSSDKISGDNITSLNYKIENQSILINLNSQIDKPDFYSTNDLPDSFSVIKIKNDTTDLAMNWYINSAIEKVKPEDILIKLSDNNLIFINIQNTKYYKIEFKSDTTKALLIH